MKSSKDSSVKDILVRNVNDWVAADRLQEFNRAPVTIDQIIEDMKKSGHVIEERWHQDQFRKVKFYRLVKKPKGFDGEWQCSSCYSNVSKEFAGSLDKTLAENIRSGYCPKCGKRRWFNPA